MLYPISISLPPPFFVFFSISFVPSMYYAVDPAGVSVYEKELWLLSSFPDFALSFAFDFLCPSELIMKILNLSPFDLCFSRCVFHAVEKCQMGFGRVDICSRTPSFSGQMWVIFPFHTRIMY